MRLKRHLIWSTVIGLVVLGAASAAAQSITLTVGGWACSNDPWRKNICALYRAYEAQHPDIKIQAVNLKSTGGPQAGGEGLLVQIATGEVPDLAFMADTTLAQFAAAGALNDITPMITGGVIDPDDYWDAAWESVRYHGRYWGVPFVTDDRALVYNKALLANAGYAGPPKTLDALDAMAQKLTQRKSDGGYEQFGFWPAWGNWYLWGWGWLFGGNYFDAATNTVTANDPHIVNALSWEVSYVRRYQAPAGDFCGGTLAMNVDGSWALSSYPQSCPQLQYGVAPVPPPAEGHQATWSGVWTMAIPKGAKHPKEARALLEFLTSYEAQKQFTLAFTDIPTRKQAVSDILPIYVQRYGEQATVFLNLIGATHVRPVMPVANDYWSKLIQAHDAAMSLKQTPKAALDQATQEVQALLDEALARY